MNFGTTFFSLRMTPTLSELNLLTLPSFFTTLDYDGPEGPEGLLTLFDFDLDIDIEGPLSAAFRSYESLSSSLIGPSNGLFIFLFLLLLIPS